MPASRRLDSADRAHPRSRGGPARTWRYIASDSERAADRLLDRFAETIRLLAENPLVGRARPELADGLRSLPSGSYIVYYRPAQDTLTVIRIRSGYMDIGPSDFE